MFVQQGLHLPQWLPVRIVAELCSHGNLILVYILLCRSAVSVSSILTASSVQANDPLLEALSEVCCSSICCLLWYQSCMYACCKVVFATCKHVDVLHFHAQSHGLLLTLNTHKLLASGSLCWGSMMYSLYAKANCDSSRMPACHFLACIVRVDHCCVFAGPCVTHRGHQVQGSHRCAKRDAVQHCTSCTKAISTAAPFCKGRPGKSAPHKLLLIQHWHVKNSCC